MDGGSKASRMVSSSALPRLHMAAYQGDLPALARWIRDGDDVNSCVDLPNSQAHTVCGVTPLYLAAQAGHRQACALLVQAGADVLRSCSVPQSGDVFGPTDIALVHFNLGTWYFLSGVRKQRLAKQAARRAVSANRDAASLAEPFIMEAHAQLAI